MAKRITVDLPEDLYERLLNLQLKRTLEAKKKIGVGEIINSIVIDWLDKNEQK